SSFRISIPPRYTLFPYTTLFRSSLDKVESREDFYKSHTYLYYLQNKSFERKKAEGTHNEEDEKRFNDNFNKLTYEEFLAHKSFRSEEHTSELQSRENLVCRLLLE